MDIQYLFAKNGQETIKVDQYYLHSRYNPKKEAEDFLRQKYKKDYVHIFFGYGAGHFINEFINIEGKASNYLVIEPILENTNLQENIFYLNEDNDHKLVRFLLNKLKVSDRINIILSPNYEKITPVKYLKFLKAVKEVQTLLSYSENTVYVFKDIWDKNYLLNIVNTVKDKSIDVLEKKYNCPIVIASAGPSLTKQLPLLKQYRDKIILISAGSAINSLLNYGIEPDYAVSIDGGEQNYNHYKDLKNVKCDFIYDVYSNPSIRPIFNDGYYFISEINKAIAPHFENLVNKKTPLLLGGVSVATYCLSIASYITTGPIALIGQDLAYTNNQTHAIGNKMMKEIDEEFKEKKQLIEARGYFDDTVLTSYDLVAMKRVFEQLIPLVNKDNQIYNCTEGGVKLEDFSQISFEEFCKSFSTLKINKINATEKNNYGQDYLNIKNKFEIELDICKDIKKLCTNAIKVLNTNHLKYMFSNDVLNKLDKIDKRIEKNINKTALSITFESINLHINKYFKANLNETKQQEYDRIFKKSETLYKKMGEATDSYVKLIEGAIQKLLIEKEEKENGYNSL